MEINDRLKRIIFKKLVKDLSHAEIIPYEDSIWFIDRNDKYWYLELRNDGYLWWRYDFFDIFFQAFSLERNDYEPLIKELVEQVLNYKVITTETGSYIGVCLVEQVLSHNVFTTLIRKGNDPGLVEEVLNNKVITTSQPFAFFVEKVEEVLNNRVITTYLFRTGRGSMVEQVLNHKVITTIPMLNSIFSKVEEILNSK